MERDKTLVACAECGRGYPVKEMFFTGTVFVCAQCENGATFQIETPSGDDTNTNDDGGENA